MIAQKLSHVRVHRVSTKRSTDDDDNDDDDDDDDDDDRHPFSYTAHM